VIEGKDNENGIDIWFIWAGWQSAF